MQSLSRYVTNVTLKKAVTDAESKIVQPHATNRTLVCFPKQVTLEAGVVQGSPVDSPLFRGTEFRDMSRFRNHAGAIVHLLGAARPKLPAEHITMRLLDAHQKATNALVSTSSRKEIADCFGRYGITATYDPTTAPTIALNETLKNYNSTSMRPTNEQEFTALFLLSHALQSIEISGNSIRNPFYLSFDPANPLDQKLLEVLQHVHNLYYEMSIKQDSGEHSNDVIGGLIAKYASELFYLYDEKCGHSANPFRKSLSELKAMSPDAAKYVSFVEQGIGSSDDVSIVKRLTKDGSNGIDPSKCFELFIQDPYTHDGDSTGFFKL